MEAMAIQKERKDLGNEGYLERARETQLAATLLYFLLPALFRGACRISRGTASAKFPTCSLMSHH